MTLETLPAFALAALAAGEHAAPRAPLTSTLRCPDLVVSVHLDRGMLAEAIGQALVPEARAANSYAPSARIVIVHPGLLDDFPVPIWNEPTFHPTAFANRLAEAGLRGDYFHDLNYWQFYDPARRLGVQLMSAPDAFPPWETGAPLRPFLHWEYAARGLRLVHGGTLGHDGTGVLLAGSGGAGKSGTVVAGLLNGLDSVGDDYTLIDASEGVIAHPLFATLKQDAAGFARLGLERRLPRPGTPNWQGKFQFRIGDIATRPIPAHLAIKAILTPRLAGGSRTTITPIPRRDAMIALAPSGIAQMPGDRAAGFQFFSRLVRKLPCYHLSLGTEAREIAGAIAEFIAGGLR